MTPQPFRIPQRIADIKGFEDPDIFMILGDIQRPLLRQLEADIIKAPPERHGHGILLLIESPGGDTQTAGVVTSAISHFINRPVAVLALGACHSAAFNIFMAVPPEHRFAVPTATFMAHHGSYNILDLGGVVDVEQGTVGGLTEDEMALKVRLCHREALYWKRWQLAVLGARIEAALPEGCSVGTFLKLDVIINAQQALEMGIVRDVIPPNDDLLKSAPAQ
ncbi:MAG: ATP-dependent Clp protease proteolytic subunit [Patescibacteria group bacterium]|nr:ATP-dependent Clp protease proteolytic subunit [Patescibacteria group bacterium]